MVYFVVAALSADWLTCEKIFFYLKSCTMTTLKCIEISSGEVETNLVSILFGVLLKVKKISLFWPFKLVEQKSYVYLTASMLLKNFTVFKSCSNNKILLS